MRGDGYINLLIYSDSLAFRRHGQSHDFRLTYPFLLKVMLEEQLGVEVNLLLRGGGGLTVHQLMDIVCMDSGYFGGDQSVKYVAILQFGVVDCAPRPFTYLFSPFLRAVPRIGPFLLSKLVKYRPNLQSLISYSVTPKFQFKNRFRRMLQVLLRAKILPVVVGLPLPPEVVELRSPGFRRKMAEYNGLLKSEFQSGFCDIESGILEQDRATLFLSDGHHLTEVGHRYYANCLSERIRRLL